MKSDKLCFLVHSIFKSIKGCYESSISVDYRNIGESGSEYVGRKFYDDPDDETNDASDEAVQFTGRLWH